MLLEAVVDSYKFHQYDAIDRGLVTLPSFRLLCQHVTNTLIRTKNGREDKETDNINSISARTGYNRQEEGEDDDDDDDRFSLILLLLLLLYILFFLKIETSSFI